MKQELKNKKYIATTKNKSRVLKKYVFINKVRTEKTTRSLKKNLSLFIQTNRCATNKFTNINEMAMSVCESSIPAVIGLEIENNVTTRQSIGSIFECIFFAKYNVEINNPKIEP